MEESTNLRLPYIMAEQAQKHITHNEGVQMLDALVHLSVVNVNLTSPPNTLVNGERYLVAENATGLWAGKDLFIAAYQENAWVFYPPRAGWQAYAINEKQYYTYDGNAWLSHAIGLAGASAVLNLSPGGAQTRFELIEEELNLAGSLTESTIVIPTRAIVFAVTSRTTETITGATSCDCGIDGETAKYGGTLSISQGSTNAGVTGPTAYYADTKIRITANGNDFTGGKIRIAVHYMLCTPSTL